MSRASGKNDEEESPQYRAPQFYNATDKVIPIGATVMYSGNNFPFKVETRIPVVEYREEFTAPIRGEPKFLMFTSTKKDSDGIEWRTFSPIGHQSILRDEQPPLLEPKIDEIVSTDAQ